MTETHRPQRQGVVAVLALLTLFAAALTAPTLAEEPAEVVEIGVEWIEGPSTARLGSVAQIEVPSGYLFAGADDARTLLELMGNPSSQIEQGLLAPVEDDWFVVFEFDETGYIPDEDHEGLDADALLKELKSGNDAANEERERRGWPALELVGWEREPFYNEQTNNLEWATKARSEGIESVNYNTRILGRSGVMRVTLVADPGRMQEILPTFKSLLGGYGYIEGQRYADFRKGDRVAEYGLAALVAGGAAAAAVKTGLFKKLWKVIVVGVVALVGLLKKVLGIGSRRAEAGAES